MRLYLGGEEVRDPVGKVLAAVRPAGLQEHQGGRQQREYQHESDDDADSHHPAKVDHRPDAAEQQGAESHHGRNCGVEARHRLGANHFPDQFFLAGIGRLLVQFPVADNEMDRER